MLAFPRIGRWEESQITISWTANSRPIIPRVEQLIEQSWRKAMSRPGVLLFDGPMCRLESLESRGDSLHLQLSRTSYKIFMGTNLTHAELADQFGPGILANPIGLSAALISSDGFLMLGRRNANVAYYPSRVHPFAGALEPAEPLNIFDDVRRELREELSFEKDDVQKIACIGIANDLSLRQPEMIFAVRSNRDRQRIESQLDHEEHRGVWVSKVDCQSIEAALAGDEQFTPIARAAILLWGRLEFGDEWFETRGPAGRR
jgi:hypothetical protein